MLTELAAIAQLERKTIRERQAESIAIAKRDGVYDRVLKLSPEQVQLGRERIAQGVTKAKVARDLGFSRQTLYAVLNGSGLKSGTVQFGLLSSLAWGVAASTLSVENLPSGSVDGAPTSLVRTVCGSADDLVIEAIQSVVPVYCQILSPSGTPVRPASSSRPMMRASAKSPNYPGRMPPSREFCDSGTNTSIAVNP